MPSPFVTPAPTAPFSQKIYSLGQMLAACALWRTQSGLEADDLDAEELLLGEESETRNIFYPQKADHDDDGVMATLVDSRPACVISPIKRWYASYAGGAQYHLTHNRGVLLLIVMDRDRDSDFEQSARTFETFWGSVLAQLAAQSGADWDAEDYPGETTTRLAIAAIEEDQPPQRERLQEDEHYWLASAFVFYGLWPELEVR